MCNSEKLNQDDLPDLTDEQLATIYKFFSPILPNSDDVPVDELFEWMALIVGPSPAGVSTLQR